MSHRVLPLLVAAILGAPATFDVASVKESRSIELDGVFRSTPGRFTVTNLSVRWILRYAFRLRDYQVIGAPAWTETRYDVDARFAEAAATDEQVRGMLQRLLIDRFALKARLEQRPIRVYELKKARAGGALGPRLLPVMAPRGLRPRLALPVAQMLVASSARTVASAGTATGMDAVW